MKRLIPIVLLLSLMFIAWKYGVYDFLTLDFLRTNRHSLLEFVRSYPISAPIIYILFYILLVSLSIPGAVYLTLLSGFLFSQPWSTLYTVCAASTGAMIIFLATKTSLHHYLKNLAGNRVLSMKKGFSENAASYLLFLRLVPIFPFFLVNIVPGLLGVPFRTYAWTTVLGIIPATFIFCQAGSTLGSIVDSTKEFSLKEILTTEIYLVLIAMGILTLLPSLIKKWKSQ